AQAVQGYYGVLGAQSCWRAQLLSIAYGAFHRSRSRARERLRLSCGLRGNGWCVTHELLRTVPYEAFSLVEDLEYGVAIGLAGTRVHYADEASADAEIASQEPSACRQRLRWEGGRRQVARMAGFALMRSALRQHDRICFDLAMDLLVPPLSRLFCEVALLLAFATLLSVQLGAAGLALWLALFCVLSLAIYVLRGWQLSGLGIRGLAALAWAPLFVAWKLALPLRHGMPDHWIRTDREGA
ncbi:MAG TPA: glycosyl transferase family 2, partial [Nevskiaceae bacterium]|nr:glycosyl transferase family 2 [Nevskiaceae bacterium]